LPPRPAGRECPSGAAEAPPGIAGMAQIRLLDSVSLEASRQHWAWCWMWCEPCRLSAQICVLGLTADHDHGRQWRHRAAAGHTDSARSARAAPGLRGRVGRHGNLSFCRPVDLARLFDTTIAPRGGARPWAPHRSAPGEPARSTRGARGATGLSRARAEQSLRRPLRCKHGVCGALRWGGDRWR